MFSFLSEKLSSAIAFFGSKKKLSSSDIQEFLILVRKTLLDADVSLSVVTAFQGSLEKELQAIVVPKGTTLTDVMMQKLYLQIMQFLGGNRPKTEILKKIVAPSGMSRLMVVGLQGAGKTTTVAKLGNWIKDALRTKNKVGVASVDIRRPAASAQLQILSDRANLLFFPGVGSSVGAMVENMLQQAEAAGCDLFILDTAGRMHVDESLMQELQETKKAFQPTHTLLVLDGMSGQEAVATGRAFSDAVSIDSVVLSKIDSGARGGAAFGVSYDLKKPIYFMGTGEAVDDLDSFEPDRVASRIVGQGDMQGLMSRVERAMKHEAEVDSSAMVNRMMNGQMTLSDFSKQLSMVSSLGPMNKLMQFVPSMPGLGKVSADELSKKEGEFKKFRAIFSSMTKNELSGRSQLSPSRKQRIAQGAGVFVKDVDALLFKFEETKQFGRMIKKMGGFGSWFK